MSFQRDVVLTVNSPGEVATWLLPTVRALQDAADVRITVFIMPCVYASGTEIQVVQQIAGVDEVFPPGVSWKTALLGRLPAGWRPLESGRGVVLFLGGELYLAARLGRRLGYPVAAYTEGFINSPGAFSAVFVPRPFSKERVIAKGVPKERVHLVGDLMVDAALGAWDETNPELESKGIFEEQEGEKMIAGDSAPQQAARGMLGVRADGPLIALFPGSRPYELRRMVSFFSEAAMVLSEKISSEGWRRHESSHLIHEEPMFVTALSPFMTEDASERAEKQLAQKKISVWRGDPRVVMAAADLALTIPGSNTAEMAVWGVPMVVCVPLDQPEEVPLDGLLGYLERIPLVGKRLKRAAVLKVARRTKFVALPNKIADEAIVPELVSENLKPEDVAIQAFQLLADPQKRRNIAEGLKTAMGSKGASHTIAKHALALADSPV